MSTLTPRPVVVSSRRAAFADLGYIGDDYSGLCQLL